MNKKDIIDALRCPNAEFESIRKLALKRRDADKITLRAIIEYSNHCKRLCKYCGLNATDKALERYRMTADEIIAVGEECVKAGYISIVLQGGEDAGYKFIEMERFVRGVSRLGVMVTLSAGEMSRTDYERLYEAGATRYLLKHETANGAIYAELHPDGTLEARLKCFRELKDIGYATGGGFMVGLPNQTVEDIADDILLIRDLNADMAGIGTFIPHEATALKDMPTGDKELTLRACAIMRILMPKINIPTTTSLGVVANDPYIGLDYGADVIMRKATPTRYRRLYEIYMANDRETDIVKERKEIVDAVKLKGYECI